MKVSKSAAEILREAAEVIEERGKLRDTEGGERSMSRAVAAYTALCGDRMEGELQGWLFLCCLKLARATAGSTHEDDLVDLCGYASLAAECVSKETGIAECCRVGVLAELVRDSEELGLYTGDWIKWEGGDCPVDPETKVVVRSRASWYRTGSCMEAGHFDWDHIGSETDIVAYKVVE